MPFLTEIWQIVAERSPEEALINVARIKIFWC
jgi:hypothetical protein